MIREKIEKKIGKNTICKHMVKPGTVACENSRFNSLLVAWDVSKQP